jgi:Ca-activated chloride channel family protein
LANDGAPVFFAVRIIAPDIQMADLDRSPICLTLDTSASMLGPPLECGKRLARGFIRHLGDDVAFALVSFDEHAECLHERGTIADRGGLMAFVNDLSIAGQGSHLTSAWLRARAELNGNGRIVLISDGQNTDDASLLLAIVEHGRAQGIQTSTVAVGDLANRDLLKAIAQAGRGNFYELVNENDLQIIATELGGVRPIAVHNVRLRLMPTEFCEQIEPLGFPGSNGAKWTEVAAGDFVSAEEKTICFNLAIAELPCIEGEPFATLENEALLEVEVIYDEATACGIESRRFKQTIFAQSKQPEGTSVLTAPLLPVQRI